MIIAKAAGLSAPDAAVPLCLFSLEGSGPVGAPSPSVRKELAALALAEGFKSKLGECISLRIGQARYVLAGLGKKEDLTSEQARRAAGALLKYVRAKFEAIAVAPPAGRVQPVAEGLNLASYRFSEYKKHDEDKLASVRIVFSPADRKKVENACAKAALYAEAVAFVRSLVNRAPSDKTPQSLADAARGLAGPRLTVSIIDRAQAAELGMGAFLGVARGSTAEPVFIHLVYKGKGGKKKIGLVGKGITFDSGGLSLKPPVSMEAMKCDMAGAASVLAAFKVLPRLNVKAEVHGFCAVTYNMPGPDAMKPGDVVRAMNGKTIEVLNTDAEGRLVLADALVYAARQKLDAIIDLATLTGAVVTALGSKVTGAMSNSGALLARVMSAARSADEAVCELPLVRDYKDEIKSPIADLQNIGKVRGEAGAIIGGLFLEEFVDSAPWVHLDIAGTAWADGESAYCGKGGTGSIVRTLLNYLSNL